MKKKIILILTVLSMALTQLSACEKKVDITQNVSELREIIYEGDSKNYDLSAAYGFKENPPKADGVASEKVYQLTFRLKNVSLPETEYKIYFTAKNEEYNTTFNFNPVSNSLIATVEIDGFNEKSFTVRLTAAGNSEEMLLTSTLPERTISYKEALNTLITQVPTLIESYYDENGTFSAEICMRITVKSQHPYWYVGITEKDGNLKALLIDGITGEVLAIRKIV